MPAGEGAERAGLHPPAHGERTAARGEAPPDPRCAGARPSDTQPPGLGRKCPCVRGVSAACTDSHLRAARMRKEETGVRKPVLSGEILASLRKLRSAELRWLLWGPWKDPPLPRMLSGKLGFRRAVSRRPRGGFMPSHGQFRATARAGAVGSFLSDDATPCLSDELTDPQTSSALLSPGSRSFASNGHLASLCVLPLEPRVPDAGLTRVISQAATDLLTAPCRAAHADSPRELGPRLLGTVCAVGGGGPGPSAGLSAQRSPRVL